MITYIIIGVTVAVSFFAWDKTEWLEKLSMRPYRVKHQKEYYRIVTSAFIHVDHMHLLLNMISLYFFGTTVERLFKTIFGSSGAIYFVLLYMLATVISDIPSYLKNRNRPTYTSLGASGAVSAVIFAFILLRPTAGICLFFALCLPGFIVGTAYVIYSYYQGRSSKDSINHDAHLYGALFGLVFCMVLYPQSIPDFADQIRNWDFLEKIF